MSGRHDAAVGELVRAGVLTGDQRDAVLSALRRVDAAPGPRRDWWLEILGYVGGGLLLAGAVTLVGVSWDDLGRAGQVALLAGVFLTLLVAATAIGRGSRDHDGPAHVRRRVAGVLLALAAVCAALTVGVAVDDEPPVLAQFAGLLVAAGVAGWAYAATAVVAVGCLALYRRTPVAVLLVAGVVGVTVAVPEAVWDVTGGAGGAAAVLLVAGAVVLAMTGAGLWLRRSGRGTAARVRDEGPPAPATHDPDGAGAPRGML